MTGPAPRIHLSRASTSVSNDQNIRDGESFTEEGLWASLSPDHLLALRNHFLQAEVWLAGGSEDPAHNHLLTRQQFIDVVTSLLGNGQFEGVCGTIFDNVVAAYSSSPASLASSGMSSHTHISSSSSSNLSTSSSSGSTGVRAGAPGLSWGGLVSYLAAGVGGRTRDIAPSPPFQPLPRYRLLLHNKREGVAGTLVCGRRRLLLVGSRGSLTKLLPSRWRQQQHARLLLDADPDEEQHRSQVSHKVSLGTWVVGVALLEDNMAVVAASSSTLHLVDTSAAPQELLRITNLPALPSCVAAGCTEDGRWVVVGDDRGAVHLVRFPHAATGLLTRPRSEGLTALTWQDVCSHTQVMNGRTVEVCGQVRVVSAAGVHKSSVRGVDYNPVTATLMSCSGDPRASLVLWGPDHATKTYTFSMPRGVRVFAVQWTLHILVTGSSDGRLRVWNPYVPEAALAVLPPSPAPPAAILICPLRRVIITCDADAIVRVYGVEGGRCVQTVMLSFPGGPGGLALRPLTLLSSGELLVACRDYVATLAPSPPGHSLPPEGSHRSHQPAGDAPGFGDFEESDREESDVADVDKNGDLLKNSSIMSSDERRERERMRGLIRQGAAFCCLQLQAVTPPALPPDLPLPPRLASLGLTPDDPAALMAHLPPSTIASGLPAGSASAAILGSSASRIATLRPASSRPASAVRRNSVASSPGKAWQDSAPKAGRAIGRHLSPGWRPH
ncbi:WD repeat-containing protein on Y chromosome [Chionoecetes opilio]|uniref:WD repeat-containing protein on Y chromosome n=1 Tax=Chionoecetes opilio TaxID=41210 RepID=A0A8J4XWK9_CHIOP|nr:WD repeat-containing protein on Y chromosome [Chionoecetes opilio]